MLTLQEIKEKSDAIWAENKELEIPDPGVHWKDRLDALQESHLVQKLERCIFDMRCYQAEILGFQPFAVVNLVKLLMGEEYTHSKVADSRQTYEWMFNHHTGEIISGTTCNWGGKPEDFYLIKKENKWYLPPFCQKEIWRCRFGKLDFLERDIPYGVLLRINELKKLRLFNVFNVLAPIEAWQHQTDIDPIVVGSIWELPYTNNKYNSAGDTQHYFIAQW